MSEKQPTESASEFSTRRVADKSRPGALRQAIKMALRSQSESVRANTQKFNNQRYDAVARIEDYEALKDRARRIKEQAIDNLESSIERLQAEITARGGHFYMAPDAAAAREYIAQVCRSHEAKLVVKSKSMTSEEIGLNAELERGGIEVAETDLAEFILQVADEQPSHIVVPAIHRSRKSISELFKKHFNTVRPLATGEDLTRFARDILREKFLSADVGISGANVIAAESGTIVLVESEGNISMVCQAPPVHIAVAGVEKVVPVTSDLWPFIELLAPSGTGQPLTTYTQILRPPLDVPAFSFGNPGKAGQREFHLVLLDNGRLRMREDPELKQALYCIRCGACMNSCAVFQAVGGHAFGGETYSGGIGGAWEAGTHGLKKARFSQLCTGCSRCVPNCPVRIEIPWLNSVLQERLSRAGAGASGMTRKFFGSFGSSAVWYSRLKPLSGLAMNNPLSRLVMEKAFKLDRRRKLHMSARPFRPAPGADSGAVLFSDVYTAYTRPDTARATLAVFRAVGTELTATRIEPEGRAELSQGLIATAAARALAVTGYLEKYIDSGREVVVVEPSVLALFRQDYKHLLTDNERFEKLKKHSFDTVEYLLKVLKEKNLPPDSLFDVDKAVSKGGKIFIHGHCQQKSVDAFQPTIELFESLGLEVDVPTVECCGMAGSFGYKKDYYELSMNIAADLYGQIDRSSGGEAGKIIVLASGVSCSEQISAGAFTVLHPMELLEKMLKD